ncbi:MAG: mitofilin family membrane protein [Sulfitobacter sp.]
MPKTTRAKPSARASTEPKKPSPTDAPKPAVRTASQTTVKTASPEPAKKPDIAVDKQDAKPADAKSADKPAVDAGKTTTAPKEVEKPSPAMPPKAEAEKSGGVFLPLLIGGALAAILGFLASEMNLLGTRGDTSDLRATLTKQQAQIVELQNAEPQVPEIDLPDVDGIKSEISALSETVAGMEARLTEVEKRPITGGSSTAAVAAYERELAALQASVEEQRSEIEGLLNNALSVEEATADAARNATLQGALTRITAAINGGKPFASALADLQANGLNDIPAALSETSENGVVTLINLQTRFPDAARAALSAARANGSDETASGVGGFLKRQLGARSVAPREGTDPDAVLSRAEAAVRDGRLTDALAEIDTLPEISQSAMEDWLADARARQSAEAAAEDLSQRLTAN